MLRFMRAAAAVEAEAGGHPGKVEVVALTAPQATPPPQWVAAVVQEAAEAAEEAGEAV